MRPARGAAAARRPRCPALLGVGLTCLALAACGNTSSQPAWVPAHPDSATLSFETTAPGVCAITVQYPNDAPAAIGYLGSTYVQVQRRPHASSNNGHDLGRSGDWQVLLQSGGDLLLVTPGDAFDYRPEANC